MCDRFHYPFTHFESKNFVKSVSQTCPFLFAEKIKKKDLSMKVQHLVLHLHGKQITN